MQNAGGDAYSHDLSKVKRMMKIIELVCDPSDFYRLILNLLLRTLFTVPSKHFDDSSPEESKNL